jgi:hypothetical protein
MSGRLAIGVAIAACFLTTGGLYAQGPGSPAGPTMAAPNTYSGPASYGPPVYGAPSYGSPVFGSADTGDWSGNYAPGNADAAPGGYPPQAGPHGYMPPSAPPGQYRTSGSSAQPNVYVDCNGMTTATDTRESDEVDETPFEEILCRVSRNIIFNVDYLNWGILKPENVLIGATPTLATMNPVQNQIVNIFGPGFLPFFPANSLSKNPTSFFPVNNGFARAYSTAPFSLYENSGIKGTLSLPMTFGTAELSGFTLQHANSQANVGGLPQGSAFNDPPDENFAAIGVKVNGMPSSLLGLYSQSFQAEFSSLVFGGEFNIVFNPIVPQQYGLLVRPLVGFRYLGVQEEFDVQASNPNVATTTIESRTINNIYGPQVGLRFELVTQWFTIGCDPRVMVGVNQFASSVNSSDPTIGNNSDYISTARFSAVGALDVYAKVPIHDKVKLYCAYNLLGTGDISRPQQQIDYNVNESGGVFTNDIHLDLAHANFIVQGISAGLEFNF